MAQMRISPDGDPYAAFVGFFPAWQIEEMRKSGMHQHHFKRGAPTTEVSGLITSLKQFQVLRELRVDANILFGAGPDELVDEDNTSRFGKLLPESLERLGLGHFRKEFSYSDLKGFVSEVQSYCPSLVSIGVEVADVSKTCMTVEEWKRLHSLYKKHGVDFHELDLLDFDF